MTSFLPLFLLVGIGALIAVQATVNGALGRSVGLALFAVVFSIVQTVVALPGLAFWGWPPRFNDMFQAPWWHHLGAVFGVFILVGIAYGIPRTGTFVAMCALLVGQMAMGVAIDHFGLFGAHAQPMTFMKVIGLVFLSLGVLFIKQ